MDIRNWPLDRIMQLPDSCFGRRFLVSCTCEGGDNVAAWDISELAFPERFVIWEAGLWSEAGATEIKSIRIALGDQVPATTAAMDLLEPIFPGLGVQGPSPRVIPFTAWGNILICGLRVPLVAMGRRLVLEVAGTTGKTPLVVLTMAVSSTPKEVPDWLISGPGRGL